MIVRTVAPAKINWTLEVLGKREDGYHEIRSVMQTIDLCDEVIVEKSDRTTLGAEGYEPDEGDLTLRAVRALEEEVGRELPVAISLLKRIPVAAGLGGGSSDAAAVLRAVHTLLRTNYEESRLVRLAGTLGSDVPFFMRGGTTAVSGRGEQIKAVIYGPTEWLVLLVPPMKLADKTKTVYASLDAGDFGDGSRTIELVRSLRASRPLKEARVQEPQMCNAFERVAYQLFEGLDRYRDSFLRAGAPAVHLAGSGPALFALAGGEGDARDLAARIDGMAGQVFVAKTLGLWDATKVEPVDEH